MRNLAPLERPKTTKPMDEIEGNKFDKIIEDKK